MNVNDFPRCVVVGRRALTGVRRIVAAGPICRLLAMALLVPGMAPAQTGMAGNVPKNAGAMAAQHGPFPITVMPDLSGKTCDQVKAFVEARTHTSASPHCGVGNHTGSVTTGTVNWQSIPAGTISPNLAALSVRTEASTPVADGGQGGGGRPNKGKGFNGATVTPPLPETAERLPDLRGLSCQEATSRLTAQRIALTICEDGKPRKGYADGVVSAQFPAAGAALPLPSGTVVRLQLQPTPTPTPTAPVTPQPVPIAVVPDVIHQPEYNAISRVETRRLKAEPRGPAASTGRRVLAQNPPPETRVTPGSAVVLTMGLMVPSLINLDCAQARARAAEFGHAQLDCTTRAAESTSQPTGRAIEQSPPASDEPLAGPVAMHVVIRTGVEVVVPDVTARPLDEALAAVRGARLRPKTTPGATADRDVRSQRPPAGTMVEINSAVELETVVIAIVPDLVGSALPEAITTLQGVHLRGRGDSNDAAATRAVTGQEPAAGQRAPINTVVSLHTEAMPRVPDLTGRDCVVAQKIVGASRFSLDCVDTLTDWQRWFARPRIAGQTPPPDAAAPGETRIQAQVRNTTYEWVQAVGDWPPAAVGSSGAAASMLLFGTVAWRRRTWPFAATPPEPADVAPPPKPPLVNAQWRVEPDMTPALHLRLAATPDRVSALPPSGWRLVADDAPAVLMHGLATHEGDCLDHH